MKFLVCVKQVVDTSHMEVDPETGRLKRNAANSILNPMDRNALEAAFSLREQTGGTVTVLTMGPPQAEAVLREAAGMGADALYLATDRAFGGADTLATSYTLSKVIDRIGPFDLIFCGQESMDSNTAQIGPEIAATLGIASVSGALDIRLDGDALLVKREMMDGADIVELSLPAVVTATSALNHPRYESLKGIMEKDEREIHTITAADLGADPARIGVKGSPTQVSRVRPVVPPKKENLVISDCPHEEAANRLLAGLKKLNVI